jgi:hypothetical protein
MNGSISPQIIIASATVNGVNNNNANVSADTLHDLDTGTVLFIKTSTGAGLAAQTANNVRDSIEFQIGVSNNKDVTGLNAKLLPPIKVSNISAFKRIAYAAPVKQMTIVGATIGDAIGNGDALTKDKYYICIASGTMVTAGGGTLSQVWSPSGAAFVDVPNAGAGAAVVAGNIYLATANGTVGAAGAANLFAELTTETTLGTSLAAGSEVGIYLQDDSNLPTQGKHEPGDRRWYTELRTASNTIYEMLDNIVTQINNSNPVARAIRLGGTTEATIDTEIIILGSKVAGDKFTVKGTYEYLNATVTDQILASKGQGTYAQMVELVKLAGYNYGGGTGSYELQNQYFPAYANEVAKLGASSTTFSQYHIRCSTDRTNPFGIKQQVSNLDYFIIVPNNSGVNDNTHTHITAIQAAINTALGL